MRSLKRSNDANMLSSNRRSIAAVLGSILNGRSATYASGPITSGKRLYELQFARSQGLVGDFTAELQRTVIEPNLQEWKVFMSEVRVRYPDGVIDPSKMPFLPEWKQLHYYKLWEEVICSYVHIAIFADGWEYSSGCAHEFAIAAQSGALIVNARGEELSRSAAARLIADAISEIQSRGLYAPFLRAKLYELECGTPVAFNALDWPSGGDQVKTATSLLGCILTRGSATYVCSPLRDGIRYLEWLRDFGTGEQKGGVIQQDSFVERVTMPNCEEHARLVDRVRRTVSHLVIDPLPLVSDQWTQSESSRLRRNVIEQLTERVVLGEGWQYSVISVEDFCAAIRSGVAVVDSDGNRVPIERGTSMIRSGKHLAEELGVKIPGLDLALDELSRVEHAAC